MSDRLFLKRIQGDLKDLDKNRVDFFQAIQDESNIKLFYFLLRPLDEPYNGGLYIGKIELPNDYPKSPGSFYMLTPNGRFSTNSKICLTNSSYHKENWTPIWSIRNMVLGVSSIFIADDTTGISHIKDSFTNRKNMAINSIQFNIDNYPSIFNKFNFFVNEDYTIKSNEEITKIINEKKVKDKKEKIEKIEITFNKLTKEETQKEETQKEETQKEETPKEETTKEETTKEETTKEETPKEETPKEETPKEETQKEETQKEKLPKKKVKVIKRVVKKKEEYNPNPKDNEDNVDNVDNEDKKTIKKVVRKVIKKKDNENNEDNEDKKTVKKVVKKKDNEDNEDKPKRRTKKKDNEDNEDKKKDNEDKPKRRTKKLKDNDE